MVGFPKYLSAEGCFHALRISPTWILSKLTLTSFSFSDTSLAAGFAGFALALAGSVSPVDFTLILQKKMKLKSHNEADALRCK